MYSHLWEQSLSRSSTCSTIFCCNSSTSSIPSPVLSPACEGPPTWLGGPGSRSPATSLLRPGSSLSWVVKVGRLLGRSVNTGRLLHWTGAGWRWNWWRCFSTSDIRFRRVLLVSGTPCTSRSLKESNIGYIVKNLVHICIL